MVFFDKIKKEIEKKEYKVYEVNLSLEVVKNGIQFENFEKLQNFMSDQNINTIFFAKYYDNYENYVITEETFRKARRDEKFLLCTNKQLRKNYARNLFKKELGNHYKLLKDVWTTDAPVGVYTDAIDFIEMIWKEIKQN